MKVCPQCGARYPDEKKFCVRDGQVLGASVNDPSAQGFSERPTLAEPSPKSSDPLVGTVLAGRYRILSLLGKGGMGAVYKAEHVMLGRLSAVKVILPEVVADDATVARFKREADMASRITHPNAVSIHDFGETEDGTVFLAMEFVEGKPLTDILKAESPLAPERIVRIARQVADALDAAHAMHIVHRDLKPDNIMVGADDRVKVVDFGIAKSTILDEKHRQVTRTGFVVGTPQYMSPEQILGDPLDPRSDVYSFGIVVYEMLTSSMPFEGESAQAQMVNRLAVPPLPLRQARPGLRISAAVEAVVMKALQREREYRYASVGEFVTQLDQAFRAGTQDIPHIRTNNAMPGPTQFVSPVQTGPSPAQDTAPQAPPVWTPNQAPFRGQGVSAGYAAPPPFQPQQFPPHQFPPQPFPPVNGPAPAGMNSYPPTPNPLTFAPPPPTTQPRKKSKAPVVVGVVGVVVLFGAVLGGIYFLRPNPTPTPPPVKEEPSASERIRTLVTKSRDLREREQYDQAHAKIEEALKLDRNSSAALVEKAEILWEQARFSEAEDLIYQVINRDPNFAPARQTLGVIYNRQGKRDDAIREEKRVFELDPEPEYACYAHMVLADIYLAQYYEDKKANVGRLDDAELEAKAALKALTRDSLEISPRFTLVYVNVERGKNDAARTHIQKILDNSATKDPQKATARNQLGITYYNEGDYSRAATEFAAAAKLDPSKQVYRDNLENARKRMAPSDDLG